MYTHFNGTKSVSPAGHQARRCEGVPWVMVDVARQRERAKIVSPGLCSLRAPVAPRCVPNLKPAPQAKAPGQANRPLSQRDAVCSVCCLYSAVAPCCHLSDGYGSLRLRNSSPHPPPATRASNQGAPLGGSCKDQGTRPCKVALWEMLWSVAEGECKDGARQWRVKMAPAEREICLG